MNLLGNIFSVNIYESMKKMIIASANGCHERGADRELKHLRWNSQRAIY